MSLIFRSIWFFCSFFVSKGLLYRKKVVLLQLGKSCTTSSHWIPQGRNTARVFGCSGAIQVACPFFVSIRNRGKSVIKTKGERIKFSRLFCVCILEVNIALTVFYLVKVIFYFRNKVFVFHSSKHFFYMIWI